jgi:hypothetical protein
MRREAVVRIRRQKAQCELDGIVGLQYGGGSNAKEVFYDMPLSDPQNRRAAFAAFDFLSAAQS